MNIALIQSGGIGARVGANIPKQFIEVNGKPIVIYTLENFEAADSIDSIAVICLPAWKEKLIELCKDYGITKLKVIADCGETGFDSIMNGLESISDEFTGDPFVMIHEAVRPMVSVEIIEDSIKVANKYGSAVAGIACVDEMVQSEDGITTLGMIPRDGYFSVQNPHTFRLSKLLWAYNEAKQRGITQSLGTAVLMNKLGVPLYLSKGNSNNFKITIKTDVKLFEAFVSSEK